MKFISIFLTTLFLLTSCGWTGHIVFYNFDANKYDVQNSIEKIVKSNPKYEVPYKWSNVNKGDYFERMYIYFKDSPEEVYRLGFTDDSTVWKRTSTCRLGFVSKFDGEIWKNESDLSNKEKERIQNRLETEIFSQINFKYYKSQ